MVPALSIVFMGVTLVFIAALAVALPVLIKKKWDTAVSPYFIGVAAFIVFALVLEGIMNVAVIGAAGDAIISNMWLYALYGGLAAGVFEETGRFVAMRFVMKKHRSNDHNALMYGAGHGCGEAILVVGITMVVNIVFSVMINAGQMDQLISSLPAEQQDAMRTLFSQLTDSASYLFLISILERITAVLLHISLSVLVWTSVVRRKTFLYPLAIFIHALADAVCVIMQQSGANVIIMELVLFLVSVAIAFFAYFLWKRNELGKKAGIELPVQEEAAEQL